MEEAQVRHLVGMEHLLRSYKVFTRVTAFSHRGFHLTTKHLTRLLTPRGGRRIQGSLVQAGMRIIRDAVIGVGILHCKNGME